MIGQKDRSSFFTDTKIAIVKNEDKQKSANLLADKKLQKEQEKRDKIASRGFEKTFGKKGQLVGYTQFEDQKETYIDGIIAKGEPVFSASFIFLRYVGTTIRQFRYIEKEDPGTRLKKFTEISRREFPGVEFLPTFEPVIKCKGCGDWAMLLELDPPNFKEDSFNPRATQVQKLEDLPPALDYFEKILMAEVLESKFYDSEILNCSNWEKSKDKRGLATVCPKMFSLIEADTLEKKNLFPEQHTERLRSWGRNRKPG